MPPKKSKDNPAKFADKENLARAETEILALQRLLELRSHEALEARRSERLWRERVEAFNGTLSQHREDTLDITADMVRQYKTMQDQLTRRVGELEGDATLLRKALEDRDAEIRRLKAEMEAARKAADAEIVEYQQKMEEMQGQFAAMLKDTIAKLSSRVQQGVNHSGSHKLGP